VPLALGPIDLRQHDPETLLGVLIADSLEEVRRLVSCALSGRSDEQQAIPGLKENTAAAYGRV
jgi:hypothetical protein